MYYDIIIIGAGTAGLTASIYARRAGKSVLLIEQENFGGQIVYSPLVENYPGMASVSGNAFADSLLTQAENLGAVTELAAV
ncbi:MAG: FAD-binding protein, partial [Fibrobacterales bacterium]|nr:FAD-binding protein [Fibrobacterales bacterium]